MKNKKWVKRSKQILQIPLGIEGKKEGWRREEGGGRRLVLSLGDFLEVWGNSLVNSQFPMVIHCHSTSGPGSRRGPGSCFFNEEKKWGPDAHRFLKTTGPVWTKLLLEEIKSLRGLQRGGYKRRERSRGYEDKEAGIRGHKNTTKMLATVETFASGHMRGLLSVMKWCLGWEQLMQVWSLKVQQPSYGNSL